MAFFTAEHLTYLYPNGLRALDDVSFSIEEEDCVGLVGANGAGKSTLLALLCSFSILCFGCVWLYALAASSSLMVAASAAIAVLICSTDAVTNDRRMVRTSALSA